MLTRFAVILVVLMSPMLALGQSLADRVPADSILYVGWSGSDTLGPGYKGSNLEAVLDASSMRDLFDRFIPQVAGRIAKEDPNAAQVMQVFRAVAGPVWHHPTAIFFAGLDLNNANGPTPKLGLICRAGADSAALQKQLEQFLQQVGPTPVPVHVAKVGDLIALTIGYDSAEAALAGGPGGAHALATDANFTKALAQVDKGAVLTGYIDLEKLLALGEQVVQMAPPDAQQMWPKVRDALGIKGLKRAVWSEGFDGKEWGSRLFVAAPEPRQGLIGGILSAKPLSNDILKSIPQNVTIAGAGRLDLAGLIDGIRTAAGEINPDAQQHIDQMLEMVNQNVGFDVRKDLLGSLGDEWAYYVDPNVVGRSMLGMTIVNRLKDPAKAEKSINDLQEFINKMAAQNLQQEKITLAFRQTKIGSLTVHYLAVPAITPAWTIHGGNLYVGLYPQVVAAAAEQGDAKGKSILDNPGFVALQKRLGAQKPAGIAFIDLPKTAPDTYGTWLAISRLVGVGDMVGVQSPVVLLPPLPKLLPLLSPAGQASWSDADGLHVRAIVPFPAAQVFGSDPGSMSVAQQALAVSILLPALNRAREQANRVKSASNLRQIGLGAIMYANGQRNGALPTTLGQIGQTQDLSIEVFVSPRTKTPPAPRGMTPKQQAEWIDRNSDYVWAGAGKNNTAGADEVLAWEKPDGLNDGINILFGDGHVEFDMMDDAMQKIQKVQGAAPQRAKPKAAPQE